MCEKLKIIYFNDIPWPTCGNQVAEKFSELKRILRKKLPDKTELEMLEIVTFFSSDDIRDYLG